MFTQGFLRATRGLNVVAVGAMVSLAAVGCRSGNDGQGPNGLLDPTAVGRFDSPTGKPLVVPIMENLDVVPEDTTQQFANARPPRQDDLEVVQEDYRIGRNDLVSVAITGLIDQFAESVVTKRVTESGNVSLPLIDPVRVLDLTEAEAERAIRQAYADANVIQNANVSVTVIEARARTFSILGAVGAPGQYAIIQSNFRLMDALVLARDVINQPGVDKIYIIRTEDENGEEGTQPQPGAPDGVQPDPSAIQPQSSAQPANSVAKVVYLDAGDMGESAPVAQADDQPVAQEGVVIIEGEERMVGPGTEGATTEGRIQTVADDRGADQGGAGFDGFNELRPPGNQRVIEVDYAALQAGDLRYNVVIRPNDMIVVPVPSIGEYYMGGHVLRPGVYSMTGRKITLKQAVISASMFDALAIPSRTEVIRRLPNNREVYVRVDLDKIWAGEAPDLYLKPNDVVNIGTNAAAPFLAALRGAFRFTYGFGFLYDRNFYDEVYD